MTRYYFLFFVLFFISANLFSQPERIGAGLSFSNKRSYNTGQAETGNPGLILKTWMPLNKRNTFHIVPSVTAFNPLSKSNTTYITTAYLFLGDLDFQVQLFHDKTLKLVGFAGYNYTHMMFNSKQNPDIPFNLGIPESSTISGHGASAGAALEMRMSPFIDFILSGRYMYSFLNYDQTIVTSIEPKSIPVIQVLGVYYFHSRGAGYFRK